mgnify:CR=1 FL=1
MILIWPICSKTWCNASSLWWKNQAHTFSYRPIPQYLANGIKYGDHKPINITLTSDQGIAHLEVQDQGIGIAPEDHSKIFERFERVVPTGNKASGLGLGLHIVREIVVAHQGTIGVNSELGMGSKFTV